MEEIIYKYLNKTISIQERDQLKDWLDRSADNRAILSQLSSFYKNNDRELSMTKGAIWNEINNKLDNRQSPSQKLIKWPMLKIAAIFVLISSMVLTTYYLTSSSENRQTIAADVLHKTAPLGSKTITNLPDGTKVFLNAGSKISFNSEFQGETRNVTLSGEAFFEVTHDKDKPFFVKMNGDIVKVLGTSFNIRSYPKEDFVQVSVATGKVSYSIPSGDEVILEPGRMATYDPEGEKLVTGEVNELSAFAWKDKVLYFDDLPFNKIILELERWYGVDISYDQSLNFEGSYTEQFDNPSLKEVLNSLSFVYRFTFDIKESNVTLNKIST